MMRKNNNICLSLAYRAYLLINLAQLIRYTKPI